jgi:hypothetical protein
MSRFQFERQPLANLPGTQPRTVREVNPSYADFVSWISSVGASVALNDLDGDALPNDVCYVDVKGDQVIVLPAPSTPNRYPAFALDPSPLPYDGKTMAPMGSLPGDYNEDGLMDILVYYWGRSPILFLRQADKPSPGAIELKRSLYKSVELMPEVEIWNTNCGTQADLDGDGHIDLIFGNYFPDGDRVLDPDSTSPEPMQDSMSRAFNGGRNRILLWTSASAGSTPSAQFNEIKDAFDDKVAHAWTLAVGAADLDGDTLPELYFANDFGPDRLLHNRSMPGHLSFALLEGRKGLTTPNSKVLGRDSFKGMGIDFGDLNGDGILDLYVSNIADEYALEESHFVFLSTGETDSMKRGVAPYVDGSERLGLSRSGWGWDTRLVDLDNDGILEALQAQGFIRGEANRWPNLHELAMGNDQLLKNATTWPRIKPGDDLSGHGHNPIFVRSSSGRYYDLAQDLNLDQNQITRGIATADVDGDGRMDYAVANQWDTSYLYRNECPDPGSFLGIHLLLPVRQQDVGKIKVRQGHPGADIWGRPAIGASAAVYLPDGKELVAIVDGGNGHSGKRSPDLHLGLGRLAPGTILKVVLNWRDTSGQVHKATIQMSSGWHTVLLGS